MRRVFVDKENVDKEYVRITDPDMLHHIRDVLRIKEGDNLVVTDGKDFEYDTVVKGYTLRQAQALITCRRKLKQPAMPYIAVACALPKNSNMDDIVDKLTQLGVDCVIPLLTRRSIVRLDKERAALKVARWRRIALSASMQSQRQRLPLIEEVSSFVDFVGKCADFDLKLIPCLEEKSKGIGQLDFGKYRRAVISIGPEGDFTPDEVRLAKEYGFLPVSLGSTVLRVETAALAVASYIRLHENS